MSTFKEIITRVDEIKPNAFSENLKLSWLTSLNGKIAADVFLMDIAEIRELPHGTEAIDCEPLVGFPHEEVYDEYLAAKIDAANGEANEYQNRMQIYDAYYINFVSWFKSTYDPVQGNPNCHGLRPKLPTYYITYGLAVMHGFTGTLEQWLESLTAYGIAKKMGFEGSVEEWLSSLKGESMPSTNYEQTDSTKADYLKGKDVLDQKIEAAQTAADKAQTSADNAQTAANKMLPLTGGTMNGNLYIGSESNTSAFGLYVRRVLNNVLRATRIYWNADTEAFRVQAQKTVDGATTAYNYLELSENDTKLFKPLSLDSGGTDANNAKDALSNLGATPLDGSVPMTGMLTLPAIALKTGGGYARTIRWQDAEGNQLSTIGISETGNRLLIRQYNLATGKNEYYTLPAVTDGLSANTNHQILTSKNPVSVKQGGTDATTADAARTNLGMGATLWDGSWSKGNITVPDTSKYRMFMITMSGQGTCIPVFRMEGNLRGIGGYINDDGKVVTYQFTATYEGNTWTWGGCHSGIIGGTSTTNRTVTKVWGLL